MALCQSAALFGSVLFEDLNNFRIEGIFDKERFSCDMDRVLKTDRFSEGLLDFDLTFFSESDLLLITPRRGSDWLEGFPCSDVDLVLSKDKARGLLDRASHSECDRGLPSADGSFCTLRLFGDPGYRSFRDASFL